MSDILGLVMRQNLTQENEQTQNTLIRTRQADADLAAGKISPEQHAALVRGGTAEPSVSQRLSGILEDVDKAPTQQTVPSDVSMMGRAKAARVPLTGFGPGRFNTDATGANTDEAGALPSTAMGTVDSAPVATLRTARAAKLRSFPDEKTGQTMTGDGADAQLQDIFSKYNVDTGQREETQRMPSGPTAGQKGAFEGRVAADTVAARGPVETQNAVNTENAMRGPRAATAGATALASKRADLTADLERAVQTGGLLPEQVPVAARLAGEFETASKPFFTLQGEFRKMVDLSRQVPPEQPMTGPQAVGFMYSIMKINDPGAAVQEGDKANVSGAGGIADQIATLYNKAVDGGFIAPNVRQQFLNTAKGFYESGATEHQLRSQQYATQAAQQHIDPKLVVRDPAQDLQAGKTPIGTIVVKGNTRLRVTGYDATGQIELEPVP